MNSYDNWVGQLISDGYDLSNWTDEGLFEYYEQLCEESLEKGQSPTPGGMIKPKITPAIPPKPPKGTKVNTGYKESYGESNVLGRLDTLARDTAGRVGGEIGAARGREKLGNILGIPEKIGRERGTQRGQAVYDKAKETVGGILKQSYEYDLYDIILSHLLDEGYADTVENAESIMVNMSEDWRDSIVEDFPNVLNFPSQGGSRSGDAGTRGLKMIQTPGGQRGYINKHSGGEILPSGTVNKIMGGNLMVKNKNPKSDIQTA